MTKFFPFHPGKYRSAVRRCLHVGIAVAITSSLGTGVAMAAGKSGQQDQYQQRMITVPQVDAMRGRQLFVTKGCITCHSIKGVGGKAAPALDASQEGEPVDLLNFAARMWRGATAMQELQELELGYRIELSGGEIGDLAMFTSDPAAQNGFSIDEVPELLRDWFIDEIYWDEGEWPETDDWQFPK